MGHPLPCLRASGARRSPRHGVGALGARCGCRGAGSRPAVSGRGLGAGTLPPRRCFGAGTGASRCDVPHRAQPGAAGPLLPARRVWGQWGRNGGGASRWGCCRANRGTCGDPAVIWGLGSGCRGAPAVPRAGTGPGSAIAAWHAAWVLLQVPGRAGVVPEQDPGGFRGRGPRRTAQALFFPPPRNASPFSLPPGADRALRSAQPQPPPWPPSPSPCTPPCPAPRGGQDWRPAAPRKVRAPRTPARPLTHTRSHVAFAALSPERGIPQGCRVSLGAVGFLSVL